MIFCDTLYKALNYHSFCPWCKGAVSFGLDCNIKSIEDKLLFIANNNIHLVIDLDNNVVKQIDRKYSIKDFPEKNQISISFYDYTFSNHTSDSFSFFLKMTCSHCKNYFYGINGMINQYNVVSVNISYETLTMFKDGDRHIISNFYTLDNYQTKYYCNDQKNEFPLLEIDHHNSMGIFERIQNLVAFQ